MTRAICILVSILLLLSVFPKIASAAESSRIVKEFTIPNHEHVEGDRYFSYKSSITDLGTVTVPEIAGKKISQVQLWNGKTNVYLKHLSASSGSVYNVGTIFPNETLLAEGDFDSSEGYFAWFRGATRKELWAYDLNGVRHWRLHNSIEDKPQANGKFFNTIDIENAPLESDFQTTGNLPAGYSPSKPEMLNFLQDEVNGKANWGWAARNIEIDNTVIKIPDVVHSFDVTKTEKPIFTTTYLEIQDPKYVGVIPKGDIKEVVPPFYTKGDTQVLMLFLQKQQLVQR
jgi:hypothetical protein